MSETSTGLFASEDIDKLIDRLGRCVSESELTPQQWRLLVAIFSSASSHFEVASDTTQGQPSGAPEGKGEKVSKPPKEMTPKQLREQLHKAYVPGKAPPPFNFQVPPPKVQPGPH
jgi:hypothetical protein